VAVLDRDLLGQQLAPPGDDREGEADQREAEEEAERRGEQLVETGARLVLEVAEREHRDEPDRADGGQQEEQRDRPLDAPLRPGAGHREPGRVVHDLHAVAPGARLDHVEPARRRRRSLAGALLGLDGHDFPAIQIVEKISATMPTRKITMASGTGP
jgi:hypothetical protein